MLFPLFILLGMHPIRADWQDFPGIIAGFHSSPTIDIEDIMECTPALNFSYRFADIYRKKVSETLTTAVIRYKSGLAFSHPFTLGHSSQVIAVQSWFQIISADNQEDETAVAANVSGRGTDNRLLWAATDGVGLIGLDLRYAAEAYESDIVIRQYPIADDENLNDYFLDLLPATFGNNINAPINPKTFELSIWGSTLVADRRLRLHLNRLQSENDLTFNYFNSSSNATLSGKRQLNLPVSIRQNRASLSLLSPEKKITSVSLEIFDSEIRYDTDHQFFDATDIRDLGNGKFARNGITIRSDITYKNNVFYVGLSAIDYSGEFTLKTPLLGYAADPVFGLEIIPIAHWAEGRLRGGSFAQLLGWSKDFRLRHTTLSLSGDYIHARYKFNLQGEAHLEFGILSSPIDYPVNITANMYDLSGRLRRNFKRFSIIYSFRQIIPLFKRTDDSPVKISEPAPGKRVTTRGGQTHQISLEYRL